MEIHDIVNIKNINRDKSVFSNTKNKNTSTQSFNHVLENRLSQMDKGNNIRKIDHDRTKDKKLMDTCIQMESIFVGKMLKAMRDTVPKTKLLHGGFAEEIFEDMLYDEYALNLSKTSNLGIADMLYKDLSRF